MGFALLVPLDEHIHLEELDVHPDHGRRGLGRQLVQAVVEWAREAGYPAITLTTFRHLAWNAPFYRRLGFADMDQAALTRGLRALLKHEADSGLDPAKRVAMRRVLSER